MRQTSVYQYDADTINTRNTVIASSIAMVKSWLRKSISSGLLMQPGHKYVEPQITFVQRAGHVSAERMHQPDAAEDAVGWTQAWCVTF
jgi:hypothetical protein